MRGRDREREREGERMEVGWQEALLALCAVVLASLVLYSYNILWLGLEKKREKLRSQGIGGPSPSLFYGNISEMKEIHKEEKARIQGGGVVPANYSSALFPYFDRWRKEYGPLFIYSTGSIQLLHVSRHDLVKEIGLCKSLDLGKPTYLHKERGVLLGRGILASNGAAWAHQRKVIAPELFMDKVKGMAGLVVEAAIPILSSWDSKVESGGETAELVVDEDLRSFSADVISRACFGSSYSEGKEIFSKIRQIQKALSKTSLFIGIPGMRYLPTESNREIWRLDQEIRALILNIVKERKERPLDSSAKDLLQSIIQGAGAVPDTADDFVVDNCKNIYFAGHETTAATAAWCLMLLGSHPEWQARARAEVLEVCQGRMPDADMLRKMKTLTMVVQETLRRYPPASFVAREALQDMKLGDIVIPKGIVMQIPISNLHHDPVIWGPDADEFKPERFEHGIAGACKLPHVYIPFGIGARTCAGQNFAMVELKIVLSLVLSRFVFSLSPRYIHSPAFSLTIEPGFGVPLILKRA